MRQTDVVVVAFNSGPWLARAVAQALASPGVDLVWVVDNNSSDDCLAALTNPRIRCVRNTENLGFGTAANQGWRASAAEHILFLNPDCLLGPDDLQRLSEALHESTVGLVSAQLLNSDGSPQRASLRYDPTPTRAICEALGWHARGVHQQPPNVAGLVEVQACSGALMLMPRRVLEQCQGFDEQYFLHCEDLDLCRRVRDLGYRVLVDTRVRVPHAKGTSSVSVPRLVIEAKYRGMLHYFEKFDRAGTPAWLSACVYAGAWLRRLIALLRAR